MKNQPIIRWTLIALVGCVALPGHAFLDKVIGSGGTETEADENPRTDYKGVKHAIGVRDFTNDAGWRGHWDLGDNLGAMLESALYDSGRFVVVQREKLGAVIDEQNLANSGRAAKSEVAQTGKLRSAKFVATGSITTVDYNSQGSEGGISFGGVSIGGGGKKATITAIITITDSTTGEIVAKKRVTGKAGGRKLRLGLNRGGVSTSLGGFAEEPLGEAAQDVISKAVDLIVDELEDEKLDGSVVTVSGERVIINRGEQFGIEPGHRFIVRTQGEVLIDPSSGEILDRLEGEVVCTLKVDSVREKIAYCSVVEGNLPERGALVMMQ
jgi:curli biogenesis system outer membrane secretion channel CsgG